MKFRFLLIFLFVSIFSFSQSMIDVIRASNYYSKAMDAYDAEKYNDALAYLKDSEINLKGKTNGDLEFLKIMVKYKLKDYEAAYTSLIQFFNGDYKKNRSFFKNIHTYDKKHQIEYDEYLTKQFIDIENKYNLLKGINPNISAERIALRLLTEKRELISFMRTNTITDNFSLNFTKADEIENDSIKKTKDYTIYFDMNTRVLKNAIIISGKSDGTNFNVICNYTEEASLLKDGFYYTFTYNDCKASQLQLGWNDVVGGQKEKGLKELNLQRFHIKPKEVHTVPFTDEEIVFLREPENLQKLTNELKKQGF